MDADSEPDSGSPAAQRLYSTSGYRQGRRGRLAGTEVVYFEKTFA